MRASRELRFASPPQSPPPAADDEPLSAYDLPVAAVGKLIGHVAKELRLSLGAAGGAEALDLLCLMWEQRANNQAYGASQPLKASQFAIHKKQTRALDILRQLDSDESVMWTAEVAAFVMRRRQPPPADMLRDEKQLLQRLVRAARRHNREVVQKLLPERTSPAPPLAAASDAPRRSNLLVSAARTLAHERAEENSRLREYLAAQRQNADKMLALNQEIEREERRVAARAAREKAAREQQAAAAAAAARAARRTEQSQAAVSIH